MRSIRAFLIIVILTTTLIVFLSALNGYRDSMAKAEQLFDSELVDKAQLLSMAFSVHHADTTTTQQMKEGSLQEKKLEKGQSIAEKKVFSFQIWQNDKLLLRSFNAPVSAIARFEQGFQDRNFLNHR